MGRVKVGVIGVGVLGNHHARLYRECQEAELVGVYDVNAETAARIAQAYDCQAFTEIAALAEQTDALSVAVPTDRHFAVASQLLNLGKHVLVEKPMASNLEEGRQLVELANRRQLVLQVGHVENFNPVITYLEERIDNPRFIEAHRLASYPPPRPGMPPRGTEVGVVYDLMIHDIDIILHLVNSEIIRIDAVGIPVLSPTEDIANARLAFANGCVANITASRVSQEQMRKIRVFQGDAYLSLDYGAHKGEICLLRGHQIEREEVPINKHNALLKELETFIQCVQARQSGLFPEPAVSGLRAQHAMEIAEQILQAIEVTRRQGTIQPA